MREAILRELIREGQVFYLFNRVRGIQSKVAQLQKVVPEARIAFAHGQMSKRELEHTIEAFVNKEFDVIVCTTIIESGVDMPNVNTIVVEDADKMGLAQLYQIRGRVGRSNRQAYAYLTFKRDKVLNEIAEKRLQAIREYTEFGSGFKIAMRDLQIRGAGNLLGPEQHGHLETVGYETYCRLLEETVNELKGLPNRKMEEDINIDISIDAYIDNSYIEDEKYKLEIYKTISTIQSEEDAMEIKDELIDRFGDIPEEVINLINIVLINNMSRICGFYYNKKKKKYILINFIKIV